ncbi:MAG: Omp28-related outer membrane protein [Candidatus Cryptobacteroides sp.]
MRRFTYIMLLPLFFLLGACSGTIDDSEKVPEGVLKIFVDKTSITADGSDCATFKVMFGSQDVSTASTMKLVREFNGEKTEMSRGVNTFTSVVPGEYEFYATYYYSGDYVSENKVIVTVTPTENTSSGYKKVLLGMQFTSMGCSNCPALAKALSDINTKRSGQMVVVSFHGDYGGVEDIMKTSSYSMFYNYLGFQGLPYFSVNMKKGDLSSIQSQIEEAMDKEFAESPAVCGIALTTSVSDNRLTAKVCVTSDIGAAYRYHLFIVEDGIHSNYQAGISGSEGYTHNNVVRHCFSDMVQGIRLNSGDALVPGVEVSAEKTLELNSEWVVDNLRVVAAAMISSDGGKTWYCINATSCKLGKSVDYK